MSQNNKWMIYGATGYSGRLIVKEAVAQGLKPVLAGRSEEKVKALAIKHDLDYEVFSIDQLSQNDGFLSGVDLVLNCAGPFSQTAAVVMEACLHQQAHYIDITGEVDVFELAASLNQTAEKAGIVLCPGVGFDVIPTDCVAAQLKQSMPDATHLTLGFDSRSGFSPGTAKTSVEALPYGGKVRVNGEIKYVPLAYKTRKIDFGAGEKLAMTIPWGDVSTAYYSTGIPNIEVYIPGSPKLVKRMKRLNYVRPFLAWQWVQNMLKRNIDKKVKGPSESTRKQLSTQVWGEVCNGKGETKSLRIETSNGYELTAHGSVHVVKAFLQGIEQAGFKTPSMLLGNDLINQLPGTVLKS